MNGSSSDFELPASFGARSAATRISSRSNLNQIHTIKAKKTEHIKKMESHNSILFQIKELGAELMLSYEELGRDTLDFVSGNYFLRKFKMIKEYLQSLDEEEEDMPEQQNVVTVTKVDVIQKQLEELKAKMEKIHSEVKKKNDEIEYYRKELQERSPRSETHSHRRTSLMPAELDDEDRIQQVKENKRLVMEEMVAFRRRVMSGIDETD